MPRNDNDVANRAGRGGPAMGVQISSRQRLMSWAIEQLENGRSPLDVKSQMVGRGIAESTAAHVVRTAQDLADHGDPDGW